LQEGNVAMSCRRGLFQVLCVSFTFSFIFASGQDGSETQFTCGREFNLHSELPSPVPPSGGVTISVLLRGTGAEGSTVNPNFRVFAPNTTAAAFTLHVGAVEGPLLVSFVLAGPSSHLYRLGIPDVRGRVQCLQDNPSNPGWWKDNSPWVVPLLATLSGVIFLLAIWFKRRRIQNIASHSVNTTKRAVTSVIGSVRRVENVEMDSGSVVSRNVIGQGNSTGNTPAASQGPSDGMPHWEQTLQKERVIGASFPLFFVSDAEQGDWAQEALQKSTDSILRGRIDGLDAFQGEDEYTDDYDDDYTDSQYDETTTEGSGRDAPPPTAPFVKVPAIVDPAPLARGQRSMLWAPPSEPEATAPNPELDAIVQAPPADSSGVQGIVPAPPTLSPPPEGNNTSLPLGSLDFQDFPDLAMPNLELPPMPDLLLDLQPIPGLDLGQIPGLDLPPLSMPGTSPAPPVTQPLPAAPQP